MNLDLCCIDLKCYPDTIHICQMQNEFTLIFMDLIFISVVEKRFETILCLCMIFNACACQHEAGIHQAV